MVSKQAMWKIHEGILLSEKEESHFFEKPLRTQESLYPSDKIQINNEDACCTGLSSKGNTSIFGNFAISVYKRSSQWSLLTFDVSYQKVRWGEL